MDEKWDVRNLMVSSELSQMDQVSVYFQNEWETLEIFHNMIHYFDVESTYENEGDLGDTCSSRDEFDGESLPINDNFYNTSICYDNIFFLRLGCNYSFAWS